MELRDVIALAAALIAVGSAALSAYNLRLTSERFKMDALKWQRDYFSDLLRWAELCMDVLSESVHLCDVDPARSPTFFSSRLAILARLSALIDRGRFFFPNYPAAFGKGNPVAFRGYRHEVLDVLVAAYRHVDQLDFRVQAGNRTLRPALVEAKREFTSQIQEIVDPRSRATEYEKIIKARATS